MEDLFWIQVIASFFIGGIVIGGQSIAVEKAPKKYSGIIAGLPTTMVVSLFFLFLGQPLNNISNQLSGMPLAVTGVISFMAVCCLVAPIFKRSIPGFLLTLLCSYGIWIFFPFLAAIFRPVPWSISVPTFIIIVGAWQYVLWKKVQNIKPNRKTLPFSWPLLIFRSLFAGTVIAVSLIIFNLLSPFWGIVIGSAFPIAWSVQVILFYWRQPRKEMAHMFLFAPMSSSMFVVYFAMAAWLFPLLGVWWGSLVCTIISWIIAFALSKITNRLQP